MFRKLILSTTLTVLPVRSAPARSAIINTGSPVSLQSNTSPAEARLLSNGGWLS